MEFRIASTFTQSLVKLTGPEQKAVKTTAFDLQLNPSRPGMQFHRIERSKDPHIWAAQLLVTGVEPASEFLDDLQE